MSDAMRWDVHAHLAPCAPEPAGQDLRGHAAYAEIRAEVARLEDAQGGAPDWMRVETSGLTLLAHGKDLLVACFVAWARCERHGVAGLVGGVVLVRGLLDRFTDQVWPQRERGRIAALRWLIERIEGMVDASAAGHTDFASLAAELEALQHTATRRIGEHALPCTRLVARLIEKAATPAAPEKATPGPAQESAAAPAATQASASAAPHDAMRDEQATPLDTPAQQRFCLVRTVRLLSELAHRYREADLSDPRSYRLLRVAGGLAWEALPAASERGRTALDPPSLRIRRELAHARETGALRDVVALSETLLGQQSLWLDAHYLTATALESLGAAYAEAREVVVREGRALLARLPGLAQLSFADGTPLAASETLALLGRGEHAASLASTSRPPTDARAATSPHADAALVARVVAGDAEARAALERALDASRSARGAFQLRLVLARALEEAGQVAGAARIYSGLERELDAYRIDRWEPALARDVVLGLWRTLPALAVRGTSHPDAARVGARVAQLAPTALL